MELNDLSTEARKVSQEILGHLNFSSGTTDPRFLGNVNQLFGWILDRGPEAEPAWQALGRLLRERLAALHGRGDAFRQVEQAERVLRLVFDAVLPAYRQHHRDLLFHQTDDQLFQPLFIGRVCEAVLQQGSPWVESDRIVAGALRRLNDFIGHRPVAVLRSEQKIQPYAHEWVRPIPLYVRGAGIGAGRYRELIHRALGILHATDSRLLFQAWFDPELLDELGVDPRAYDFDHPVNRRPNYLFGQWDLGCLDNSGYSRRFVLQQISLDAMLHRVENRGPLPYEEVLFEAAAVLAGTMLMGSGVSGNRPDAHDSTTTLATLVQHIAAYRDAFYEQLLTRLTGPHAERLRAEAAVLRQPFGGARQHFNQDLARRRAEQLQHVHLSRLFARMGYTRQAARQVRAVAVASARMQTDIRCRLSTARLELKRGRLDQAAALGPETEDLLHRAIECGALVDPWNMLGFAGQYSLFPAPENSVPDHRVDELIDLVGEIFNLYMQIQQKAAAAGDGRLQTVASGRLDELARWWDKFASVEVGSVSGFSGRETKESADCVVAALGAWHEAGTAAGDVAFWRRHVQQFHSPKAYALVVEALLEQHDLVAAMGLLIQWLSQAGRMSLVEEDYTFHDLALWWMEDLWRTRDTAAGEPPPEGVAAEDRWSLARKFLDFLEANAEEYWEVPRFELAREAAKDAEENEEEEDRQENLFSAAYEHVTYRDSTDDGFEGEMLEGGEGPTDFELVVEAERIAGRLAFLTTLARLWKWAATASIADRAAGGDRDDVLAGWLARALADRGDLMKLLSAVHRYRIPPPRGTHEAMIEYDRHRAVKESLLEQIIAACVEMADAGLMIRAAMQGDEPDRGPAQEDVAAWERPAVQVLRATIRCQTEEVDRCWSDLLDALTHQPLLYVSLARGGSPHRIVASQSIHTLLRRLLAYLPRLGLLENTSQLLLTIQRMEMDYPVGPGATTEFDQIFRIGCRAITRCLVVSSAGWRTGESNSSDRQTDQDLVECLEKAVEALLRCWLTHSRGVRLSVLETVSDGRRWRKLKRFVERYGGDLFTQRFMNLGNLRAILHQGVDAWLESLQDEPEPEEERRLLAEVDGPLSREEAARQLTAAIEAVVENYPEYIDYNSTTTQSDRGELLYTLLDFLRLKASYDRVAWNLVPLVLAHDILVRCGRHGAAGIWQEALARRTVDIAEDHLRRFARLVKKYGMRLPSIADRLAERFVRPLAIDRLCALVRPAIGELRDGRPPESFTALEQQIAGFTEESSGAGFELPSWLQALEQEVELAISAKADDEESPDPLLRIAQVRISRQEAERQVEGMLGQA